ncbi:hypothetical protein A5655_12470 [Mycobacterium sp. 1081908.1]|nr:hypothetical protein A5655_12470 [Mycobacterium sp. 1081908.1]
MNEDDFLVAVGEAAQDAVWKTQHPLTHHLAEDDPRRVQYLREYQMSVGRQVIAAIEHLRRGGSCHDAPRECAPVMPPKTDFALLPVARMPAGGSSLPGEHFRP